MKRSCICKYHFGDSPILTHTNLSSIPTGRQEAKRSGRLLETLARGMLCEGTCSFPSNSQTFAKPCDICEAVCPSNSKKGVPFFPIGRGSQGRRFLLVWELNWAVRACRGGQIQGRVRAGSMGSGPRGVRAPYMTLVCFLETRPVQRQGWGLRVAPLHQMSKSCRVHIYRLGVARFCVLASCCTRFPSLGGARRDGSPCYFRLLAMISEFIVLVQLR